MPEHSMFDPYVAMPTLWPAAFGLLLLLFVPLLRRDRHWLWLVSLGGMSLTIFIPAYMLWSLGSYGDYHATAGVPGLEMIRVDRLALWLDIVCATSGLLALLLLPHYLQRTREFRPEVFPLIFIAVAGMTILVSSEHLLMIFLGLEVLSIALYVLTGVTRSAESSIEAALKYFLLGAFATGFLVYGIALVFGATGTMDLTGIATSLALDEGPSIAPYGDEMLLAGIALILVAFCFKIGVVPFHFWTPDVYQGAPTPITAFMAAGTKAAAFGVLLRILHSGFESSTFVADQWAGALSVIAAVTMILGNLLALVQRRVKRMLAYSSVAHAGYLLLGLMAPIEIGVANTVFYLVVYCFMTIGAFAVVAVLQQNGEGADRIADFHGLWQRRPLVALAMGVFMLSLLGLPPLGGFTGKYVIFLAALGAGHTVLAAIMAVAAVIGAAYYLQVVAAMFFHAPDKQAAELAIPVPAAIVLTIAVTATILLGVLPNLLLQPLSLAHSGLALVP